MSRLDTMLELTRKLCTVRLSVPVRLLKEAEGLDTPIGGTVTRVSLTLVRGEVVVSVTVTATMGTAASELSSSHSGYLGKCEDDKLCGNVSSWTHLQISSCEDTLTSTLRPEP